MAGTRLNNEKKIDNENFKLKIGTTNKLNPVIVYVEGKAFISPMDEKDDYSKDMSDIKYAFKQNIRETLSEMKNFEKKFLLDFQVASSGISVKKKSFLTFQFFMRQKKERIMKLNDVKNMSAAYIGKMVDTLSDDIRDHNYLITKTKK